MCCLKASMRCFGMLHRGWTSVTVRRLTACVTLRPALRCGSGDTAAIIHYYATHNHPLASVRPSVRQSVRPSVRPSFRPSVRPSVPTLLFIHHHPALRSIIPSVAIR